MYSQFVEHGYLILRNAIDVEDAVKEMHEQFPRDAENPIQDFGSGNAAEFPSSPALNHITVHPFLLNVVRQILGFDILLKQSVPWAKYGVRPDSASSNNDQRMHMDYGNNQWDMPTPGNITAVAAIVYYSDTTQTGGATAIVPRQGPNDPVYAWPYTHMPGISGKPFINSRQEAEASMEGESASIREKCYEREIIPTFKPGDVLLYGLDTWHRGTPVNPGHVRYVHNLLWSKKDADIQQWNAGFTRAMYGGDFERFISNLAPEQLQSIGFPAPTDRRWCSAKFVQAMRARYKWAGFDVMKYIHSARLKPPPIPQFWIWATRLETSEDPFVYRDMLFDIFSKHMHISMHNAMWHYTLETCNPYYVNAEFRFFTVGHKTFVDINLMSGDRWTWSDIIRCVKQSLSGQPSQRKTPTTYTISKKPTVVTHVGPHMDEHMFDFIGSDVNPKIILHHLNHASSNIRRCLLRTLFHCNTPFDISIVEPYASIIPTTFLEERVKHWATKILEKSKYVAHL